MDFPKKQAQRLMPLYLLEYSEKLFENHPNPEAPWGGGGGDYTAGYGIDITNSEISVDTDVIATKSDIASMVTTTMLDDALDDYALKTDIPENVSDLNNDAGYTTQTWVENQGYITGITSSDIVTALGYTPGTSNFSGSYNDLTNKPDLSIYAESSDLATVATTGSYNDLSNKPTIPTVNDPTITFTQGGVTKGSITLNQSTNQTIALDAGSGSVDWTDITNKPNLLRIIDASKSFTFTWQEHEIHYPPYRWGENMACTSTWICYGSVEALPIIYLQNWFSLDECYAYPQYIWQDQNGYHAVYSTEFGGASNSASGGRIVLNASSLGATWTSVSTYPVYGKDPVNNATITLTQGGVNKGSFTVNQWQNQTIALDAAGSSYSAGTGIDITNNEISIDNTVALKSELFSGNYNDLSNKPTIPDAVSGTNDGTNWTTLTIGNSTYDIPQGGSTPGLIGEVLFSSASGSINLTLTMAHSFADYSYVDIQWINNDGITNSTRIYEPNGKTVNLLSANIISGGYFDKVGIYSLSGTTMTQVSKGQGAMINNGDSLVDYKDNTQTSDYIKITKVIGYKANSSALTSETWTFTLQDGTTITKNIVTA